MVIKPLSYFVEICYQKDLKTNLMKHLFLILLVPLLAMTPPNKEARQRKVVEEYVHTLLNTDDEVIQKISNNEDIQNISPLLKLTRTFTKEEIDDIKGFLLFVKQTLKGHKYKIVNFKEGAKKLKKDKITPPESDRGDIFYIYDIDQKGVFFQASIIVDDDYKIISIALGMCDLPQRLCFLYL